MKWLQLSIVWQLYGCIVQPTIHTHETVLSVYRNPHAPLFPLLWQTAVTLNTSCNRSQKYFSHIDKKSAQLYTSYEKKSGIYPLPPIHCHLQTHFWDNLVFHFASSWTSSSARCYLISQEYWKNGAQLLHSVQESMTPVKFSSNRIFLLDVILTKRQLLLIHLSMIWTTSFELQMDVSHKWSLCVSYIEARTITNMSNFSVQGVGMGTEVGTYIGTDWITSVVSSINSS